MYNASFNEYYFQLQAYEPTPRGRGVSDPTNKIFEGAGGQKINGHCHSNGMHEPHHVIDYAGVHLPAPTIFYSSWHSCMESIDILNIEQKHSNITVCKIAM